MRHHSSHHCHQPCPPARGTPPPARPAAGTVHAVQQRQLLLRRQVRHTVHRKDPAAPGPVAARPPPSRGPDWPQPDRNPITQTTEVGTASHGGPLARPRAELSSPAWVTAGPPWASRTTTGSSGRLRRSRPRSGASTYTPAGAAPRARARSSSDFPARPPFLESPHTRQAPDKRVLAPGQGRAWWADVVGGFPRLPFHSWGRAAPTGKPGPDPHRGLPHHEDVRPAGGHRPSRTPVGRALGGDHQCRRRSQPRQMFTVWPVLCGCFMDVLGQELFSTQGPPWATPGPQQR